MTDNGTQLTTKESIIVTKVLYCECDCPTETLVDDRFSCSICGLFISCEICELDDIRAATIQHLDYLVCKEHEEIAIWSIYQRSHNY